MGLTYVDVLEYSFGEDEFTTTDVRMVTGSERSAKLLSELKLRGVVERTGRGRYRFFRPSERPDVRDHEWNRIRGIILRSPWKYAWNGSTAVELWTNGRYKVYPNAFLRVFHILVEKDRLSDWTDYLLKNGVPTRGRKRVGSRVSVESVNLLKYDIKDNEPVIKKEDVLRLIREHPGIYATAEELIED